jgi:hypothetical protein
MRVGIGSSGMRALTRAAIANSFRELSLRAIDQTALSVSGVRGLHREVSVTGSESWTGPQH